MGRGVPFMTLPEVPEALGMRKGTGPLPNENIKIILRTNDEQIHCNRFKWYNLPRGIDAQMIERIIYYRGQLAMAVLPDGTFAVLPFCLNGGLDIYGRYTGVSLLPWNGTAEIKKLDDARNSKAQLTRIISAKRYDVLYQPIDLEDLAKAPEKLRDMAVILSDYTRQIPQIIVPKYKLTEPIIDYESKLIPYLNTALSNATGIIGVRVGDQSEQSIAELASEQMEFAALTGKKWVPITGGLDFQELTGGQVAKAEEFLLTMQSLDNYRLGIHGVENGGLFEKKAHTTDLENSINLGTSGYVMKDALYNRQQFCTIINSLWGLSVWVEPDEISVGADYNMDGIVGGGYDEQTVDSQPENNEEVQSE